MSIDSIMSAEDVATFTATGEVAPETMQRLYEHFLNNGEMPYGVAKARTGDPDFWIYDRLAEEYAV
jgi:hypothetical protein